jgi:prepilin-type N-terminal cleavage/methylation domain-containing protein
MISKKRGFTLIEVMVAVMIVSVVIAALWQMRGDASTKFSTLQKMQTLNPYATFLLANSDKYGFEKSTTNMKSLVDDFDLESDLRRQLKNIKVHIRYDILNNLDSNDSMMLEIGTTTMELDKGTISLIRMRLQ